MPNYCSNDLYISGTEANVAAVLAHIAGGKPMPAFDFDTVIPYPERFRQMDEERRPLDQFRKGFRLTPPEHAEQLAAYRAKWGTDSDGFNSGGYDWCCEHWGTKWNADAVQRRDRGRAVCLTFDTAWAPPLPVVKALAARFPECDFSLEYFERGMGFCGGVTHPSKENYYGKTWVPGITTDAWRSKRYRGQRGG